MKELKVEQLKDIELFLFDMDGTLFDTQKPFIKAWNVCGEYQGFENMGKHIPEVCGMNEAGNIAYLNTHFPKLDYAKFRQDVRDYMLKNVSIHYKKGAKELLDYLKSRNIKIGLASGSTRGSIDHHLKAVGAENYFDVILGSEDIERGKPAPDIFLKAANLMGVKPEDCFVFEDSENGIKAGFNAGMKCIGVEDIVPFDTETKNLMYCELDDLSQAIEMFENEL
jgi:HAD superfamily hydrolase (TIGR01509 family)